MQADRPTVWLARHGNRQDFVDPEWPKTAERPFDPGLSPDGFAQARRLAQRLRDEGVTHLFVSPFLRTVQTANEVAEVLDLPLYLEPGLGEWLNPEWFPCDPERLPLAALAAQFPRIDVTYTPCHGSVYPETWDVHRERAGETARRLVAAYPTATPLIVGHGASVTSAARGLVPAVEVADCALCSLFKVVRTGDGWHMELCGDVSHLDHAEAANRFV